MDIPIADPADPLLDDYRTLRDPELRKLYEGRTGVFIAESPNVVRELLASRYAAKSVFLAEERRDAMADALALQPDVQVLVAPRQVVLDTVQFPMHQGVIAVGVRPESLPTVADVMDADLVLVLEEINDTVNLGGLFRTARALGVGGVVLGPRCADPLYRRTVRVSMGHVLHVPWTVASSMDEVFATAAASGITTAAMVASDEADQSVAELAGARPDRVAVVLGAEGPGLSRAAIAAADVRVTIPMADAVDSLNVAVAGAIACHALRAG